MKRILFAATVVLSALGAGADDILQWQDNSLSFLAGGKFKLDPETQQTITVEHASGWSVGDLFIFVDGIYFNGDQDSNGNKVSYYGEIAPRFSAGKIMKKDLTVWFIKDFLAAGCYEFGENSTDNLLGGLGVDLAVPGFDFVQLNVYRRFNDLSRDPEAYQVTPVWKLSVPLGKSSFIFDGFIDWVIGDNTDNLHICPQLKFDVGIFFGMRAQSLLAGVEYDYWKNKYGVQDGDFGLDTNQSAISALVKYHF